MKSTVFAVLSIFIMVSCLKSARRDLGPDKSVNGSLKYLLDNFPVEITGGFSDISSTRIGVYAQKQIKSATVPVTRYTIVGQIESAISVNIVIPTDSLRPGSYTTAVLSNGVTLVKRDSIQYSNNRPVDNLTVNIVRNSGGTIDGNFEGRLSLAKTVSGSTTYTTAAITSGSFEKVAVRY